MDPKKSTQDTLSKKSKNHTIQEILSKMIKISHKNEITQRSPVLGGLKTHFSGGGGAFQKNSSQKCKGEATMDKVNHFMSFQGRLESIITRGLSQTMDPRMREDCKIFT